MIRAEFHLQLPDEIWIADVSQEFPSAVFKPLSGYKIEDRVIELGEAISDNPDAVVTVMRDHPSIETYELLQSDDRHALAKYESTDTDLYEFVEQLGVTIEFLVTVQNGWYEFDLTGTHEEFNEIKAMLEASPLSYELQSLVNSAEADALLTDRQQDVLEAAVREGYFEIRRACTLAELASSLDPDHHQRPLDRWMFDTQMINSGHSDDR
jgi:Predicted DNA binding protein